MFLPSYNIKKSKLKINISLINISYQVYIITILLNFPDLNKAIPIKKFKYLFNNIA